MKRCDFPDSDLKVDGVLDPELGSRGAGAAAPPGCGAGADNVPTGLTSIWSHCPLVYRAFSAVVVDFRGIFYLRPLPEAEE